MARWETIDAKSYLDDFTDLLDIRLDDKKQKVINNQMTEDIVFKFKWRRTTCWH